MDLVLGLLIYDGDCGFCTWSLDQGRRVLPALPEATTLQTYRGGRLTADQLSRAVWFVDATGARWSGHRAIAEVLRRQPHPGWRVVGAVLAAPPVSWLAALAYRWVAGHRYRLPGSGGACAVR